MSVLSNRRNLEKLNAYQTETHCLSVLANTPVER